MSLCKIYTSPINTNYYSTYVLDIENCKYQGFNVKIFANCDKDYNCIYERNNISLKIKCDCVIYNHVYNVGNNNIKFDGYCDLISNINNTKTVPFNELSNYDSINTSKTSDSTRKCYNSINKYNNNINKYNKVVMIYISYFIFYALICN